MIRILVIDDDAQIRAIVREMLERAGYLVVDAQNGQVGVRQYLAAKPDLVITDMLMPEQDGLETVRELRRLSSTVKILAISGGSRKLPLDCLPLAEKLGAQATLRKPLRRDELLAAVRELLQDNGGGAAAVG